MNFLHISTMLPNYMINLLHSIKLLIAVLIWYDLTTSHYTDLLHHSIYPQVF